MSTRILDQLIYRAKNRTPFLRVFDPLPPSRRVQAPRAKAPELPQPAAGMLAPQVYAIHKPEDYGALSMTPEQIKASLKEAEKDKLRYDQQMAELSQQTRSQDGQSEFGANCGGLGLVDPLFATKISGWEEQQRRFLAQAADPESPAISSVPVKTYR